MSRVKWGLPTLIGLAVTTLIVADGYFPNPWLRVALWAIPSACALTALICVWSVNYQPLIVPRLKKPIDSPGSGEATVYVEIRGPAAAKAAPNSDAEKRLLRQRAMLETWLGTLLDPQKELEAPPTIVAERDKLALQVEGLRLQVKQLEDGLPARIDELYAAVSGIQLVLKHTTALQHAVSVTPAPPLDIKPVVAPKRPSFPRRSGKRADCDLCPEKKRILSSWEGVIREHGKPARRMRVCTGPGEALSTCEDSVVGMSGTLAADDSAVLEVVGTGTEVPT